ncbi:MAG: hypothetical protein R3Y13_05350 [bacterium]
MDTNEKKENKKVVITGIMVGLVLIAIMGVVGYIGFNLISPEEVLDKNETETNIENSYSNLDIRTTKLSTDTSNIGSAGEIIVDNNYKVGLQIDDATTGYDEVRIWSSSEKVDFSLMNNDFIYTDMYDELEDLMFDSTFIQSVDYDVINYSILTTMSGIFTYSMLMYSFDDFDSTFGIEGLDDIEDALEYRTTLYKAMGLDNAIVFSDIKSSTLSNGIKVDYIHQDVDLGFIMNNFIEDDSKKAENLVVRLTYVNIPDQRNNGNYIQLGISSGVDNDADLSFSLTGENKEFDLSNVNSVSFSDNDIEELLPNLIDNLIYFELE